MAVRMLAGWRHDWHEPNLAERLLIREVVPGPFKSPQLVKSTPFVRLALDRRHPRRLRAPTAGRNRWANLRTGIPDPWTEYLTFRGEPLSSATVDPRESELWSKQLDVTEAAWREQQVCMNQGIPDPWENWPKEKTWKGVEREEPEIEKKVIGRTCTCDIQPPAIPDPSCLCELKIQAACSSHSKCEIGEIVLTETNACSCQQVTLDKSVSKKNVNKVNSCANDLKVCQCSETKIIATSLGPSKLSPGATCCKATENVKMSVADAIVPSGKADICCACNVTKECSEEKKSKMKIIFHPRSPLCMCREINENRARKALKAEIPTDPLCVCESITAQNMQIKLEKDDIEISDKNICQCNVQNVKGSENSEPKNSSRIRINRSVCTPISPAIAMTPKRSRLNACSCAYRGQMQNAECGETCHPKNIALKLTSNPTACTCQVQKLKMKPLHSQLNICTCIYPSHTTNSANNENSSPKKTPSRITTQTTAATCTCPGIKTKSLKQHFQIEDTIINGQHRRAKCSCECNMSVEEETNTIEAIPQVIIPQHTCNCQSQAIVIKPKTRARKQIAQPCVCVPLHQQGNQGNPQRMYAHLEDETNSCECEEKISVMRGNIKPSSSGELNSIAYYSLSYAVEQNQNINSKSYSTNNNNKKKNSPGSNKEFNRGEGGKHHETEQTSYVTRNNVGLYDKIFHRKGYQETSHLSNEQIGTKHNKTSSMGNYELCHLQLPADEREPKRHSIPREKSNEQTGTKHNKTSSMGNYELCHLQLPADEREPKRHSNPREKWIRHISKSNQKKCHPCVTTTNKTFCSPSISVCPSEQLAALPHGHTCGHSVSKKNTANYKSTTSHQMCNQQHISEVDVREEGTCITGKTCYKASDTRKVYNTNLPHRNYENLIQLEFPDLPDIATLSKSHLYVGSGLAIQSHKKSPLKTSCQQDLKAHRLDNFLKNIDSYSFAKLQRAEKILESYFYNESDRNEDISKDSTSSATCSGMSQILEKNHDLMNASDGKDKIMKSQSSRSRKEKHKRTFVETERLCLTTDIRDPTNHTPQEALSGSVNSIEGASSKLGAGCKGIRSKKSRYSEELFKLFALRDMKAGVAKNQSRKSQYLEELSELLAIRDMNAGTTGEQSNKSRYSEKLSELLALRDMNFGVTEKQSKRSTYSEELSELVAVRGTNTQRETHPLDPKVSSVYDQTKELSFHFNSLTTKLPEMEYEGSTRKILSHKEDRNHRNSFYEGEALRHVQQINPNKYKRKSNKCKLFAGARLEQMHVVIPANVCESVSETGSCASTAVDEHMPVDSNPSFTRLVRSKHSPNIDGSLQRTEESQHIYAKPPVFSLIEQSSYFLNTEDLEGDFNIVSEIPTECQSSLPKPTENDNTCIFEIIDTSPVSTNVSFITHEINSTASKIVNMSDNITDTQQGETSIHKLTDSALMSPHVTIKSQGLHSSTIKPTLPELTSHRMTDSRYPDESRDKEIRFRKKRLSRNIFPISHPTRFEQDIPAPSIDQKNGKLSNNGSRKCHIDGTEHNINEPRTSSIISRNDILRHELDNCKDEISFNSTESKHSEIAVQIKILACKLLETDTFSNQMKASIVPVEQRHIAKKSLSSNASHYPLRDIERDWKEEQSFQEVSIKICEKMGKKDESSDDHVRANHVKKDLERDWKEEHSNKRIAIDISQDKLKRDESSINFAFSGYPKRNTENDWKHSQENNKISSDRPAIHEKQVCKKNKSLIIAQSKYPTAAWEREWHAQQTSGTAISSPLRRAHILHKHVKNTHSIPTFNVDSDTERGLNESLNGTNLILQPKLFEPVIPVPIQHKCSNSNLPSNSDNKMNDQQEERSNKLLIYHADIAEIVTQRYNDQLEKLTLDSLKTGHHDPCSDRSCYWVENQTDDLLFYADKEAIVVSCSNSDITVISKLSATQCAKTVDASSKSSMLYVDPLELCSESETRVRLTAKPSSDLITAECVSQLGNEAVAEEEKILETPPISASKRAWEMRGREQHHIDEVDFSGGQTTTGIQTGISRKSPSVSELSRQVSSAKVYLSNVDIAFFESDFLSTEPQSKSVREVDLGEIYSARSKNKDFQLFAPANGLEVGLTRLFDSTQIVDGARPVVTDEDIEETASLTTYRP